MPSLFYPQIDEALTENMLDDLLDGNIIEQEISEQSQEVAVEVLTHYSNKVRNRDIRQVKTVHAAHSYMMASNIIHYTTIILLWFCSLKKRSYFISKDILCHKYY